MRGGEGSNLIKTTPYLFLTKFRIIQFLHNFTQEISSKDSDILDKSLLNSERVFKIGAKNDGFDIKNFT